MNEDVVLPVLVIVHAVAWAWCASQAERAKSRRATAAFYALGPALVFSPGILVGHGAMPFPAIASLALQPGEWPGYKLLSFAIVYLGLFVWFLHFRRQRTERNE
jgi:hypothetical protein